jgi:hypothetical protein
MEGEEARGMLSVSGLPVYSLVLLKGRPLGRMESQSWLTRTFACLCASASTASECWRPAGNLTSLLEKTEGKQEGEQQ